MAQRCLCSRQGTLRLQAAAHVVPFTTRTQRSGRCGRNRGFSSASGAAAYQEQRMRVLMGCAGSTAVVETAAPQVAVESPVTAMDIRIGSILSCEKHPEADRLYVEQVDVGESEPRTIVSGLVNFVPLEDMQGRKVVVLCNLKPRNMVGVKSHGMLLCASNEGHDVVEPLNPPEAAGVGERVWFGDNKLQAAPAEPNRVQKKKLWEAVQPDLKTNGDKLAGYKGEVMMTSAGPVAASSLTGANIA